MNDELKQKLSAYHDGELPESEVREFEDTLRSDPQLADELKQLRLMSRLLETAAAPSLSAQAKTRLHQKVELMPQRELTRTMSTLTAAAAIVLLVCSITLWTGQRNTVNPASDLWEVAVWTTPSEEDETELAEADDEGQLAEWIINDLAYRSR